MKIILFILMFSLVSCASFIEDDDTTSCFYSLCFEGSMSIDIFEVKVDSTFRYWEVGLGSPTNIEGNWYMMADTVILYDYQNKDKTYGSLYLKVDSNNHDTIPFFRLNSADDSTLKDLLLPNFRERLRYHSPPINLFYRVSRRKANKKIALIQIYEP